MVGRRCRWGVSSVVITVVAFVAVFAAAAPASADVSSPITATTADLFSPQPELAVLAGEGSVSAMPVRVRLLNQASPLAYSLDMHRTTHYGDAWTAVSLGSPGDPADRSVSQVGVTNPLIAQAIALEPFPSGIEPSSARYFFEYAARQVAIWSHTSGLSVNSQTVPNRQLLARAQQLLAAVDRPTVPLQAAYHSVQVFVRETTATTVRLAVVIGLDTNTQLSTSQDIDLYLDGVRCPIRTGALTRISKAQDGTYNAQEPKAFDSPTHPNEIAEVDLDRNTKLVNASATWVNVRSDPGLVLASDGAAPPLITAETAILNFSGTSQLDPRQYTDPAQLLSQAGTAFLTAVPDWAVWIWVLLALYVLPRVGRGVDRAVRHLSQPFLRRLRGSAVAVPQTTVHVEAASQGEAVTAGMLALAIGSQSDLEITVLQRPKRRLIGADRPARVMLHVRPPDGSS
jgi:hypothetical protein